MTGNTGRMQKVDDLWNDRDWDTFESLHDPECTVYWPGRESAPTQGGSDHRAEAIAFCAAFPDNRVHNQPYDTLFAQPTGDSFNVLYSRTARWREGRILEEYLFYDNATFMQQVGLG